jgi:hypothetical protein
VKVMGEGHEFSRSWVKVTVSGHGLQSQCKVTVQGHGLRSWVKVVG